MCADRHLSSSGASQLIRPQSVDLLGPGTPASPASTGLWLSPEQYENLGSPCIKGPVSSVDSRVIAGSDLFAGTVVQRSRFEPFAQWCGVYFCIDRY